MHQNICHQYRYQYLHSDYLANNWYFGFYILIFWAISMYFKRYLADTDIPIFRVGDTDTDTDMTGTDIQFTDTLVSAKYIGYFLD
jgi:hypothetical protein